MHHGPFATDQSYLINLLQVIVAALVTGILIKQLKEKGAGLNE